MSNDQGLLGRIDRALVRTAEVRIADLTADLEAAREMIIVERKERSRDERAWRRDQAESRQGYEQDRDLIRADERARVIAGVKRVVYGVQEHYPEEMTAVFDGLIYALETWTDHEALATSRDEPADGRPT